MDEANLNCRDERRRLSARDKHFNGIDDIEVDETQTLLCVHLFGEVPENLSAANVRIEGGRRVRNIKVKNVYPDKEDDEELGECLRVEVDRAGDFSIYTLRLIETDERGRPTGKPPAGFDPRYASARFSFKVNCPSDLDCKPADACRPAELARPEINYLAKDYASFRQLILDRLALVMPDWKERHIPDIGIALVEVLAYVGDYLSYYQDAVATEAYLDTARLRISVRRHARLVDYAMHEGCNARAWVVIEIDTDTDLDPDEIFFVTNTAELDRLEGKVINAEQFAELHIAPGDYDVFEPLVARRDPAIKLYEAHNAIHFYSWGDEECCLPKGATRATLKGKLQTGAATTSEGHAPTGSRRSESIKPFEAAAPGGKVTPGLHLKPGDVLIFEEVLGAKTGNPADADPLHRHAVRLTKVEANLDPLFDQPVVEIEWSKADALPFALCISAVLSAPDCQLIEDISVARGNCLLVDHGQTLPPEDLGEVPLKTITGECECNAAEIARVPGKFQPVLKQAPLTFSQPLHSPLPAARMLLQDPRKALPQIKALIGRPHTNVAQAAISDKPAWHWYAQSDLLHSQGGDQHFVVEMDNDEHAHLRFGDDQCGRRPDALTEFWATYRIGNGTAGNVGAETITHLIIRKGTLSGATIRPRNPLPATGGTEPETLAQVKRFAPGAIRHDLERAITGDDYARLAERNQKVQRAAAELRWMGSWYEAAVAVDPFSTETLDPHLQKAILRLLYRYRRIGQDLDIVQADYVPLEIELTVCVLPDYLRGHVEAALRDAFSDHLLPDGGSGFFAPDNLTFGEGIYLSKIIAAAQAVEGVENVTITQFHRRFEDPADEISNGLLPLGVMEIAQCDSDPDYPEHGLLTLVMKGGR